MWSNLEIALVVLLIVLVIVGYAWSQCKLNPYIPQWAPTWATKTGCPPAAPAKTA